MTEIVKSLRDKFNKELNKELLKAESYDFMKYQLEKANNKIRDIEYLIEMAGLQELCDFQKSDSIPTPVAEDFYKHQEDNWGYIIKNPLRYEIESFKHEMLLARNRYDENVKILCNRLRTHVGSLMNEQYDRRKLANEN